MTNSSAERMGVNDGHYKERNLNGGGIEELVERDHNESYGGADEKNGTVYPLVHKASSWLFSTFAGQVFDST